MLYIFHFSFKIRIKLTLKLDSGDDYQWMDELMMNNVKNEEKS